MKTLMTYWFKCSLAFLAAVCPLSAAAQVSPGTDEQNSTAWSFEKSAPALREQSCRSVIPTSEWPGENSPFAIQIKSNTVSLGAPEEIADTLPDRVKFIGGWHLTAEDSNFGGLSGLEFLDDETLLAISDKGSFVIIGTQDDAPDGTGAVIPMRDANGIALTTKINADAEGLAFRNGMAFVSFERNHRILAYDFNDCGAQANGAHVSTLPDNITGEAINPNNGAEALTFTMEGELSVGFETVINDKSYIFTIGDDGALLPEPKPYETPEHFKLAGASKSAVLMRAYDRKRGNRNNIIVEDMGVSFLLRPPLSVDNFEGIAERELADGSRRFYLISDDNFSGRQRTLLYVFDVAVK